MAIVISGGSGEQAATRGTVVNRRKVPAGLRHGGAQRVTFGGHRADKRQELVDLSEVQSAE
jgi:hypothetical protein